MSGRTAERPGAVAAGAARPAGAARRWAWPAAIALLVLGALALRLWGHRHGLPYVYNADENAHFVPRAIGFFGHSYNPGYFINPPGFSYLLHAVFWARWGGDGVQAALAADPSSVFGLARVVAAVLGALAVGLLALAGARLLDRRTGLVAAVLLAVAFLPVHYAHFALNDVPTLAPLCAGLIGIAGVLRRGALPDHLLAGAGIGLACATKYTAGIVVLAYVAAALTGPGSWPGRAGRLVAGGLAALAAFVAANPYAVLDLDAFRAGLAKQSSASNDGGGKLGLGDQHPVAYYVESLTWGLGWLPALAAAGGAAVLAARDRRAALVLVPAPLLCLLFLGAQDRFFARWLLPAYPLLCLLAAAGALAALDAVARRRRPWLVAAGAAVLLGAQGLVYSVHNDLVLAREDTRQLAREWLVRTVPAGSKVVIEPVMPDQWAMDAGRPLAATPNGNRWRKWPTSRTQVARDGSLRMGAGETVKLEDFERYMRPELVGLYRRAGYCWVLTGSTQYGRAFTEPDEVPRAVRYYDELRDRGRVVLHIRPWEPGSRPVPFSFDSSFNARPLSYERPGPEIVVHRLADCR